MTKAWQTMLDASENYDPERRSKSGLDGGQGEQMRAYAAQGNTISGDFTAEVTHASTSGLVNPETRDWNWELIDKANLPRDIFPPIVPACLDVKSPL